MQEAESLDFLRYVVAFEYAKSSIVATEYHGFVLKDYVNL